ncbi:MAG TPA: methyltransferase domain-containing protein [Roseiflexaceae bacterium]|nr:methyltransferase domain-containing protein [Roseiflexaceae bacterium]
MPRHSEWYEEGQQLLFAGDYVRAIECFLALAQTYPQQAPDAYERIACCYVNIDSRWQRQHRPLKHRVLLWRWLHREVGAEYQWAKEQGFERRDCRSVAWLWKAVRLRPDYVEALSQLARSAPRATPLAQRLERMTKAAGLRTGYYPPDDPADVAGWDRFWNHRLADDPRPVGLISLFEIVEPLVPVMRQRGLRSVLCLGNGIALEPRAFAHAGFAATALDLSPAATAFARSYADFVTHLPHFFSTDQACPGGSAEYVAGDLLDLACLPGPFDLISARRVVQCFPKPLRERALSAIVARLAPGGILVIHEHNVGPTLHEWLNAHDFDISHGLYRVQEAGFLEAGKGKRAAWLIHSSG